MDQHDKQDIKISSLPILTRLDRLEHLLKFVEDKHYCFSEKQCIMNPTTLTSLRNMESDNQEYQCKTLSSAIEEVHHKGTLIDRIAMLEKRLLQLSLHVDVKNSPVSASSSTMVSEKLNQKSATGLVIVAKLPAEEATTKNTQADKQDDQDHQSERGFGSEETYCRKKQKGHCSKLGKSRKRGASISVHYKEWFKRFHMGC